MPNVKNKAAIKAYYLDSRESRWGYKYLLKGAKHYGYYPPASRLSMAQAQLEMEKQIGQSLGLPHGSMVLDAGCGEGLVAIHLSQHFGYQIHGIDLLYEPSIKQANKNKKKFDANQVEFSEMDYSDLKFPDNTFDGVFTIETLVHSPNYAQTLKEFCRVLKPGGVIVNFEYAMDDHMKKEVQIVWDFIYQNGSMHTLSDFRISRMRTNWESAGFEDVSMNDITDRMRPFMRRLYELAFLPYYLLKLFGKERNHLNTFVGFKSYRPQQRSTFHYVVMKGIKPLS
jgi:sterol 24-C-methyltransferase